MAEKPNLPNRDKNLFLTGFSGSGKSTIGPLLAKGLGRRFVDLDVLIERSYGKSIANIFKEKGESYFRRLELKVLDNLLGSRQRPAVIALGGGAYQQTGIRRLAQTHGIVVYLSCSSAELYRRLREHTDRPLLQVQPRGGLSLREARLNRIKAMLVTRRKNYQRANLKVSTTARTPVQTVRRIMAWLKDER